MFSSYHLCLSHIATQVVHTTRLSLNVFLLTFHLARCWPARSEICVRRSLGMNECSRLVLITLWTTICCQIGREIKVWWKTNKTAFQLCQCLVCERSHPAWTRSSQCYQLYVECLHVTFLFQGTQGQEDSYPLCTDWFVHQVCIWSNSTGARHINILQNS